MCFSVGAGINALAGFQHLRATISGDLSHNYSIRESISFKQVLNNSTSLRQN
jgi:hypothetical protein